MAKTTKAKDTPAKDQSSLFEAPTAPEANGNKLVIIDGHALAFRSYYAISSLTNSQGRSTNAIFGFLRALLSLLKEEGEHDATVVTFDAPAKTFRHEQFEGYKAGRAPMPEDLPEQIRTIKHLVTLMGLHRLEVVGLEADDLIGTMATRSEAMGYSVEIITSDRDAYQLVSDRVCVRGISKSDRFGPTEVYEKFGVRVDQWVDYRALTGDSSDNIPGAKGIGPVTAKKLLQTYDTLDYILEHLDEVKPEAAAKKIRDSLEDVKFSRDLSRIVTDADIEVNPVGWAKRQPQADELSALLTELEFGSILKELDLGGDAPQSEVMYKTGKLEDIFYGAPVGFLLSDVSAMNASLKELAVAQGETVAVAKNEEEMLGWLGQEETLNAADAKALAVYARCRGFNSIRPGDDPLLMAYVIDPNNTQPEALARRYGAGEWGVDARSRAVVTAELLKVLPSKLEGKLKSLYETIERPTSEVLVQMEHKGIRIDAGFLQAQGEALNTQMEELESRIRAIAENPSFNVSSRDQVAELLFDKLKLQVGKKTTTGKQSTAVAALEPLREEHEVVALILDYRELSKLKSTYLDPLPRLVNPTTGRLHTTFNQTVAVTGRLSSTNPNLQNIPIRTALGREIRKGFIAADGTSLLVADYSQIELRILAHIAGEEDLIRSFNAGEDIHSRTAALIHGVSLEDVHPSMRRMAKIINFGVLYGMSAHRLTRELDIEYKEADAFIKTYFERYPNVQRYIDETLEFARKEGYVETLSGRRRMIPDINSKNRNAREYAERTAYNMPIQGTAADIMKLAMIGLAPKLKPHNAHMLLQVHDELVIETPLGSEAEVSSIVRETMENAFELKVPLGVEVGVGENWLEAK